MCLSIQLLSSKAKIQTQAVRLQGSCCKGLPHVTFLEAKGHLLRPASARGRVKTQERSLLAQGRESRPSLCRDNWSTQLAKLLGLEAPGNMFIINPLHPSPSGGKLARNQHAHQVEGAREPHGSHGPFSPSPRVPSQGPAVTWDTQ